MKKLVFYFAILATVVACKPTQETKQVFEVMWVMPIYPIGIEKGKNSPYCISDYKAIAPEFGTIEDFKKLTETCHEHGMGMILDWVANHTAWDHPWVTTALELGRCG